MGAGCHRVRAASRARSDGEYRIGNERQSVLDERPRNYRCSLVLSPSEQRRQHSAPEGGKPPDQRARVWAFHHLIT